MFIDRTDAGIQLALHLEHYYRSDAIVLAVPCGGVIVGHAIAQRLALPLDIILVKKLGHPHDPEVAVGAVSMDAVVLDRRYPVPKAYVDQEVRRIRARLREQAGLYRDGRPALPLKGCTVILVDDGIATGHTLRATIDQLARSGVQRIVLAVPVVPKDRMADFARAVDEFIYLETPAHFTGVGAFYEAFRSVTDEEVVQALRECGTRSAA